MLSCNAEALIHPTGLSTGALIAILLCIIILLGKSLRTLYSYHGYIALLQLLFQDKDKGKVKTSLSYPVFPPLRAAIDEMYGAQPI